MSYHLPKIAFGTILWGTILVCALSPAAEIRLKKVPIQSTEPLITLADIADVLPMGNENVESLRQTVLFPALASGTSRTLDQWEVRTILSQLGVNSLHHFISGAEKVTVNGTTVRASTPIIPSEPFVIQAHYLTPSGTNPVTPTALRSEAAPKTAGITNDLTQLLEKEVAKALNIYLNLTHRIEKSWDISLKLTPEQVKLFATNGQIVDITGGQIPFTGIQQFQIRMQSNVTVTVDATVALPTEAIVVRRALPKGHIISESDVMLQRVDKINGDDFFVDIKSVVGKETIKAVKELTPLTQSTVRLPIWIRRGDIVTVKAASGGVTVRTEATALQDGAEGDTITVEKIDLSLKRGKKEDSVTYLARVCAPKTVEVFVGGNRYGEVK